VTPLQNLKALVALQAIDIRIRDLEKDNEHIPVRLKQIEEVLTKQRTELGNQRNALDEAEMARRLLEGDLKAEKDKIKKWESRLNDLKNNRDYQALSREIEAARKANLGIEDEILRKMQEIEDLKASSTAVAEELVRLEQELSAERQQLEQRLQKVNEQIAGEEVGRRQAVEKIEPRWFKQYEMIRKRRDGVAVVPTLDEHCRGCHMGIPPQLYNIVLKGQEIESCPHCHRIIYYEAALKDVPD
jgi:uncharacterized protein